MENSCHILEIKNNFLFSLYYLAKEAEREGYQYLHVILENALNLALKKPANADIACCDTEEVLNFLKLYDKASPETRKQIINFIENLEEDC